MGTATREVAPLRERIEQFPALQESKYVHEYLSRLTSGRDMHTIVTAAAETGVGKTTCAVSLCLLLDPWGWNADKGTLDGRAYEQMYDTIRPGSWLILDEVQAAADARRSGSKDNVNLSEAFAENRYRQVFGVMTAPTKGWVDFRMGEDSADYWIQAQETPEGKPKGEAKVYRLKNNEHYDESYTDRVETISWPVLDSHPAFKELHQKKVERHEQKRESRYVHREEYEQLKANYWNKCSKLARFDLVRAMDEFGISQTDIAEILSKCEEVEACSRSWVNQMVNAEAFEDIYDS